MSQFEEKKIFVGLSDLRAAGGWPMQNTCTEPSTKMTKIRKTKQFQILGPSVNNGKL